MFNTPMSPNASSAPNTPPQIKDHDDSDSNESTVSTIAASTEVSKSTDVTTTRSKSSSTIHSSTIDLMRPQYELNSFYEANTSTPFKYLWSFYIQSTSRFCAIHDFETPFLSSVIPMASTNTALQSSLMYLSNVYRNKILGLHDRNHEAVSAELSLRSMRSLRVHINRNLTPEAGLIAVTTCLGLTCCFIGENSSENYNTHLYGGLMIASNILLNRDFHLSLDAWFVFKWLTYCQVLVNVNLLPVPERLILAKAQNLPAMQKLARWWERHGREDPEYDLPVDSFYGFGTRLAPLLLQLNILCTRNAYISLGRTDVEPASTEEIDELERTLWVAHESSMMAKFSSGELRQTDLDLLRCDAAFHGAALLYIYTYLKRDKFSTQERIPHLVHTVVNEVKGISPVCRTAAALLFVMYITGSYARGEQRVFISKHLHSMRQTCLSSVEAVMEGLAIIWKLRDEQGLEMQDCHCKVVEMGVNVCVY